jgi:hypothetical protein
MSYLITLKRSLRLILGFNRTLVQLQSRVYVRTVNFPSNVVFQHPVTLTYHLYTHILPPQMQLYFLFTATLC